MLEVIGHPSSRAFRVLWMLEELGEDYIHTPAKPHSPQVLQHNPSGKIPVMVENGISILDSCAILHHLASKRSRFSYSAGTMDRVRQDSWTFFLLDEIDACLWTAAKHSFVLPASLRVKEVKPALKHEFGQSIDTLALRLGAGPFLMGDEMTIPDFILTHCLVWAQAAKFEHGSASLDDYFCRMRSRPAFGRTLKL